jgi:hypothetical protein
MSAMYEAASFGSFTAIGARCNKASASPETSLFVHSTTATPILANGHSVDKDISLSSIVLCRSACWDSPLIK